VGVDALVVAVISVDAEVVVFAGGWSGGPPSPSVHITKPAADSNYERAVDFLSASRVWVCAPAGGPVALFVAASGQER